MTLKRIKRTIVAVVGFTFLTFGIIMIVFPGPAFIVIPVVISILATEFVWAKKLLDKVKKGFRKTLKSRLGGNKNKIGLQSQLLISTIGMRIGEQATFPTS